MTEDNYITITKESYRELVENSAFLHCLLDHDVSCWEGYEAAYDDYYDKEIDV